MFGRGKAQAIIAERGIECRNERGALILIAEQKDMGEIVALLVSEGIQVYTVTKIKRTLEDLYKEVSR